MIVDMFVFRIYCFSFYCIPSAVAMWLCFSCGKSVVDIYCERVRVPCLLLGQAHQM